MAAKTLSQNGKDRYASLVPQSFASLKREADLRVTAFLGLMHILRLKCAPRPISPFLMRAIFKGPSFSMTPDIAEFVMSVDEDKYNILRPWLTRDRDAPLSPDLKVFLRAVLDGYVSTCSSWTSLSSKEHLHIDQPGLICRGQACICGGRSSQPNSAGHAQSRLPERHHCIHLRH